MATPASCRDADCPICLCSLRQGGALPGLTAQCSACSKAFHLGCLQEQAAAPWGADACPMCRAVWALPPTRATPAAPARRDTSPPLSPRAPPRARVAGAFSSSGLEGHHASPPAAARVLSFTPQGRFMVVLDAAEAAVDAWARRHAAAAARADAPPPPQDDPVAPPPPEESASPPPQLALRLTAEAPSAGPAAVPLFTAHVRLSAPPRAEQQAAAHGGAAPPPRLPVDIIAAIDVSGSMAGAKLAAVRATLLSAVAELREEDRVSLVAFDDTAALLTPLLRCSAAGKRRASAAIAGLREAGGTDIGAGLGAMVDVARRRSACNPVSALFLLSDGCDVTGASARELGAAAGAGAAAAGGQLTVFGYGDDHDAPTLARMAEHGRGSFVFVDRPAAAQAAFAAALAGLLSVAAQGVQLRLRTHHGAAIVAVHAPGGATRDARDGAYIVDVDTLIADETRDVLVDLRLPERSSGSGDEGLTDQEESGINYLTAELSALPPRAAEAARAQHAACTLAVRRLAAEPVGADASALLPPSPAALDIDRQRNRLAAAAALANAAHAAAAQDARRATAALAAAAATIRASPSLAAGDDTAEALLADLALNTARCGGAAFRQPGGSASFYSSGQAHRLQRTTLTTSPSASLYSTPAQLEALKRAAEAP
jgi:uncharacterized protein YegL